MRCKGCSKNTETWASDYKKEVFKCSNCGNIDVYPKEVEKTKSYGCWLIIAGAVVVFILSFFLGEIVFYLPIIIGIWCICGYNIYRAYKEGGKNYAKRMAKEYLLYAVIGTVLVIIWWLTPDDVPLGGRYALDLW